MFSVTRHPMVSVMDIAVKIRPSPHLSWGEVGTLWVLWELGFLGIFRFFLSGVYVASVKGAGYFHLEALKDQGAEELDGLSVHGCLQPFFD